jgi:hypothetical protein
MTIFIYKKKLTENDAIQLVSELDGLAEQIVRAWSESNIEHRFKDKKRLKNGVCKNKKTLQCPDKITKLFRPCNYRFSTKAPCRKETLYFVVNDPPTTGRLRQQHRKGALAKIDKKARKHLFLSERRFCELPREKPKRLPCIYPRELRAKADKHGVGKHHIEFSCAGERVRRWHRSTGKIEICKQQHLQSCIDSALKNILGWIPGE